MMNVVIPQYPGRREERWFWETAGTLADLLFPNPGPEHGMRIRLLVQQGLLADLISEDEERRMLAFQDFRERMDDLAKGGYL